MDTKPSLCWILEASSISGGVKVIYQYANHLSQRGYPVSFFSLNDKPDWFTLNHKIKWVRFGSYEALIAGAVHTRPDIVIANWWRTAMAAAEIREKIQCRALYLVQDIETSYYADPITKQAVWSTYSLGLEHFTTSRWVEQQLPCTYTGIAIGRWSQEPAKRSRSRMALACLRRQSLKGFRELAEVGRYLSSSNVRLTTFGADQEIHLARLHEHVQRPRDGALSKMYSSCGVFISTSRHEGLSMTPLEAMACGAPVVMFNADGNMEYAVDGENCLIATDPADMAAKVVGVLSDLALASKLSKSGLQTARRYMSWDLPVARLGQLIDGVPDMVAPGNEVADS